MDIFLRNIDEAVVKKIDEIAKEQGRSRQEFLKSYLEYMANFREQTEREARLENMLRTNTIMMERFAKSAETMNEILKEMMEEVNIDELKLN
ncbi:ribbon-helix-helix protein, CopG family (plasmid) [Priestia megaterium]|uniref:ribbon-helix-helix protein, CopG family n=1 Tax=Priestia megaterium TaxID=1404 RepID=UPI0030F4A98F